ncbi:MAG: PIN domain-containing protein [Thermodesulfobacteriota bacterium]
MPTNYVLIDYENVQPKNLEALSGHPFKVLIFVGENQAKIPYEFAEVMQRLGENAKYVKIGGNGKNALDFHLAFYVGELSTQDPDAFFHVISKDAGFDSLIKHLKSRNIRIQRENDLAAIPVLRMSNAINNDEKISAIVKNLAGRGQSRPRKIKTLANTINSLFTKKLEEDELMSLVNDLQRKNFIVVNQGKVSYKLPPDP